MEKYFLSILFLLFFFSEGSAQQLHEIILDTILNADEVYIDPLNQIYIINNSEKSISKYDLHLRPLKRISFNQGWDHAVMDVSDPFKTILYYPGDFKIYILDESLAIIASYDESELNVQSAVCHFTTDFIGLFSNNVLKLKNYQQQNVLSSEPLFSSEINQSHDPYQLKQSNEYLYLLRPGLGISRFTNQLFEESKWLNEKLTKMDVTGDIVYYISDHDLVKFNSSSKVEEIIYKNEPRLRTFAVNSTFMVYLLGNHLIIMSLKS